jgi:hypothetical protein
MKTAFKTLLLGIAAALTALLGVTLLVDRPAHAAVYVVDTTSDNSSLTACTAAPNDCSLRGAVIAANSTPAVPDTITLPAGTYFIGGSRGDDTAGLGDLDVTCVSTGCTTSAALTINGAGPEVTVIDAAFSDRIFDLATAQSNITTLNLNNLTIRNGDPGAVNGGAIRVGNSDTVNLANVVIEGSVSGLSGGGISNNGFLNITNSTIRGNSSASSGGGILNGSPGSLTISGSTINGNYAGGSGGGGIYNAYGASLTNVTITENSTTGDGGGIRNSGLSGVSISLTNVTIAYNTGSSGGGIRNDKTVGAKNTLIADNGPTANCGGTALLGNSGGNVDTGATCNFWINNASAALGSLAYNGGPTQTRALLTGSAAIDAGDNNGCPGTDQRGVGRPQGPLCDSGAYEAGGAETTPTPTPQPTPAPTPTASPAPTPTPSPAPTSDNDGDGWTAQAEQAIGTDPADPCGFEGWPADLVHGGFQPNTLNVQDLGSFVTPVRRIDSSPGDDEFHPRWDLIPGSTFGKYINITDIAALVTGNTGYPPMFGGQRAFGKTCPY